MRLFGLAAGGEALAVLDGLGRANFAGALTTFTDPATGELMPEAIGVSSLDFGATLLAMAGIDPAGFLAGARSFDGLLK